MRLFSSQKKTASHVADAYTGSEVPGKTIENTIGLIQFTKKIENPFEVAMSVEEVFQSLVNLAKDKGASAVINTRMEISSAGGSGGASGLTYIVAYGDAVVLA